MLATILIALLGVALSAGLSFFCSRWFWGTAYAATNKSGDFGSPRGGVFATFLPGFLVAFVFLRFFTGLVIAEAAVWLFGAFLVSGLVGGFLGMSRGQKDRQSNNSGTK